MKNFTIAILLSFAIIGCNNTPMLSHINQDMEMKTTYQGKITFIEYERKSSLIEDLGVFIVGDVVGNQLDNGDTKSITGLLGGIATSEIYERNFADEYTKLTILANAHTYSVYIKGHLLLRPGRIVKISINDDKISGISLIEE